MTALDIRRLLEDADIPDAHEFATAYVNYVEKTDHKMPLPTAVQLWTTRGRL